MVVSIAHPIDFSPQSPMAFELALTLADPFGQAGFVARPTGEVTPHAMEAPHGATF